MGLVGLHAKPKVKNHSEFNFKILIPGKARSWTYWSGFTILGKYFIFGLQKVFGPENLGRKKVLKVKLGSLTTIIPGTLTHIFPDGGKIWLGRVINWGKGQLFSRLGGVSNGTWAGVFHFTPGPLKGQFWSHLSFRMVNRIVLVPSISHTGVIGGNSLISNYSNFLRFYKTYLPIFNTDWTYP